MSTSIAKVLVVEPAQRGMLLGDFLERELGGERRFLRDWIAAGLVRVNGETLVSSRRLRTGDIVEVRATEAAEHAPVAAEPVLPVVLFESPHALVVEKPPGLVTVPDRSGEERGLHGMLAALRPDADLRIVHRLDRDTSGCLLLAKGLQAARHFDAELRAHRVRKRYLAIVHGVLADERREIDLWLGPDPRRPGKVVAGDGERRGFRSALTIVVRQAMFRRHTAVELEPRTGRGHQLRVHLAAIGHPIVGDRDYGGEPLLLSALKRGYKPRLGFAERPLVDRTCLHAAALGFTDVGGAAVAVEAPLPEDHAAAMQKLEHHSGQGPRSCD